MCMHVLCEYVHICKCRYLQGPEEGVRSLGAGVTCGNFFKRVEENESTTQPLAALGFVASSAEPNNLNLQPLLRDYKQEWIYF